MTLLIAILVCVIVQKIVGIGGWVNSEWSILYLKKMQPILVKLNSWLALSIAVVPFLFGLAILHFLSLRHLYGLLHLLLMILVLLCCLDVREIGNKLTDYFDALEKSKAEKALDAADEFVGHVLGGKKSKSNARAVTRAIFIHSFEWIFAPLFWFLIFNIYGIALYYLVVNLRKKALLADPAYANLAKTAAKMQNILDWIPMRVVAISYSLAGHFMSGFAYCYKKLISFSGDIDVFVVNTGIAALGYDYKDTKEGGTKENQATLSLVNRTLLIWIIGLILFSLGKMLA
ncbi:MAG: hypothetical protein A2X78_02295 [Gammaproteobacteria bacterium GWE2_37_16]|nr:MAG: hypothetical protein A2X78_02295 [Gammaproteobacteria bacterium GWE2_37_16]